jgi:hypothetical protein
MSPENLPDDVAKYLIDTLNSLTMKVDALEKKLDKNSEVTELMAEIVHKGKGLFQLAYRLGSIVRWIGGVAGGGILMWHLCSDKIKGLFQ